MFFVFYVLFLRGAVCHIVFCFVMGFLFACVCARVFCDARISLMRGRSGVNHHQRTHTFDVDINMYFNIIIYKYLIIRRRRYTL